MDELLKDVGDWGQRSLIPVLGAVLYLVVGWIVAVVVAGLVKALLNRTSVDEKIGEALAGEGKPPVKVDGWITGIVKWAILLFAFLLFLNQLDLEAASQPIATLFDGIAEYTPKALGGLAIGLLGWVVATAVRRLVTSGLGKIGLDAQLKKATGDDDTDLAVSSSIGAAAYWVVLLLFLLLVLDALELKGLLEPLQEMTGKAMAFLPNLFSAAVIMVVGWFVATLVRRIVAALVSASGLERLLSKTGLERVGKGTISGLLGTIAFLLVLLPVLSASLDALHLTGVSKPVNALIDTFFQAIPNLLYAAVSIGAAVFLGRLLGDLVADLLARLGFDSIFRVLGISEVATAQTDAKTRPSAVAGTLVFLTVLVLAITTALDLLGWVKVAGLVDAFVVRAGGWLLGLFIFGLGLWFSKLVADLIRDRRTAQSGLLAWVARIAILVVAGIAAMTEANVDGDVIKWSAITAVASTGLGLALAFGLGGQQHASDTLTYWRKTRSISPPDKAENRET